MKTEEVDLSGEIKWLRMGNGSFYVDPKYTKEFRINRFINGFIKANANDEEFLETFDSLITDNETFVQRISNQRLKVTV